MDEIDQAFRSAPLVSAKTAIPLKLGENAANSAAVGSGAATSVNVASAVTASSGRLWTMSVTVEPRFIFTGSGDEAASRSITMTQLPFVMAGEHNGSNANSAGSGQTLDGV